ncbi:MAG: PrsW family glutamic-type intramembrane protease [Thermoanaerobaculia bacterium]
MKQKSAITWVVSALVILVSAVAGLLSLALIGFETGLVGFALGFVMATVPVPLYLLFPLWLDRFEPEPWWLLALTFVWGAAIATFFSMILNTVNVSILMSTAGAAGDALGAVISAPIVEELAKGLALLLLFFWQRDEFDNVTDGIVYAMMVALGFAMIENVAYYGRAFAQGGLGDATAVFVLRGVMAPFSHPLFTSMTGIGLGAARESDNRWVKLFAPALGLGSAMLLHALWNLSASFGAVFFLAYLVIMMPALVAVLIVAIFSLRREARVVRLHLESIVDDGVLSDEDLVCLCSVWGRIAASNRALFGKGFGAWRARGRFHRAATDFAFHSWRHSRGLHDNATDIRAALLDTLRTARLEAGLPAVAVHPTPELVRRLSIERPLPPELVPPPVVASLVGASGALVGERFEVGPAGLLFGRDPSMAQIVIPDAQISRKHAWVGYRDGVLVAIDHGSSNGTFINGARIRDSRIMAGDRLELADAAALDVS